MDASIRSYAGHELEIGRVLGEDAFEIRRGDQRLAWLGDPAFSGEVDCLTRDGVWSFNWLRGGKTEALLGTAVVARYTSGVLPGGRIQVGEEPHFRLRPPRPWEDQLWRVGRGREPVLRLRTGDAPWRIEFAGGARHLESLPLLTTFALHAVLVERAIPAAAEGGNGGGM